MNVKGTDIDYIRSKNIFDIYTPVNKLYFTPDFIIFSLLGISLLPVGVEYLINKILDINVFSVLSKFFLICFALLLVLKLFLQFTNAGRYKPLKGIISGKIQFESDYIIVDDKKYLINEMSALELYMYDYQGQDYNRYSKSCNGQLSNGVDNAAIFHYLDGTEITTYIRQFRQYDRLYLRQQLISYCCAGKLKFDDLAKLLAIDDKHLLEDLRNELNKRNK